MIIAITVSLVIGVCSCLQIHLYTPFKNKISVLGMAVFFVISSFITDRYLHMEIIPKFHLIFFLSFILAGLSTIMICCDTKLFCGLYNIVIQMCINMIIQIAGHNQVIFSAFSKEEGDIIYFIISIILSLSWYLIMWRLRQSVWIQMPQADEYYHTVAVLVVVDYVFITTLLFFEPAAQLFALLLTLLVLIAVLHVIKMPQLIMREQERVQMLMYQEKAMGLAMTSYIKYEELLRAIRHDLKHITDSVEDLLEHGNVEEAQSIMKNAKIWMDKQSRSSYCDHILINSVLEDYANQYREQKIKFSVKTKLRIQVVVLDLDITILLRNILSNALEYCSGKIDKEKMWTEICISTNRNYLHIQCTNPLEEKINVKNNWIITTKKENPLIHGFGLESIKKTAEKYDGNVEIRTENGVFLIDIILVNRSMINGSDL